MVDRLIALKRKYPALIKSNIGALELMKSDVALQYTGAEGRTLLPENACCPSIWADGG